jgi:superfamily II DNA/RNA helicase
MPPEITRLTKQFLDDPVRIEASRPATTAETITQYLVRIPTTDQKAKRTALRMLVERDDVKNGIVFCNRKSEVDIVAKSLKTHGFDAAPIHGDLDQQTRMRTLESFRNGSLKLLVASDVAARGLDIPDVSHVFNFDVPHHADDYVHRIGRTGRAGKLGQTFMITTPADSRNLDKVLKLIGKAPEEIKLEADWANIKDEPRSSRGGDRGRGGPRGASTRDRDRRPRPVPVHGEVAAMQPFDPSTAPPPSAEAQARPERAERPPERSGRNRGRRGGAESRPEPQALAEAAAPAPARERQERERPERERSERGGRGRDRAPRDHGEPQSPERPQAERPQPERHRADRPDRDRPDRGRNDRGRERDAHHRDDGDDGVVGFGRDVPAFLSRPPPPRSED